MIETLDAHLLWQLERGLRFPVIAEKKPRLAWVVESPLNSEENALLSKMVQAMKLTPADVEIFTTDRFPSSGRVSLAVILGKSAAAQLQLSQEEQAEALQSVAFSTRLSSEFLITLHPRELIAMPQLKRQAWTDLQIAMKHLGLV